MIEEDSSMIEDKSEHKDRYGDEWEKDDEMMMRYKPNIFVLVASATRQ